MQPDYRTMRYRRCGRWGLKLPEVSLGCWHNFGGEADPATIEALLTRACELGVTHFDLANNYGPPPGSAEINVGRVLNGALKAHRDELIISSKAGYYMWPGPYGEWGTRKNLIASCDQSLKRLGLDYLDIFYHHRPDPDTPLEETLGALDTIVRSGRALYAGISNYGGDRASEANRLLADLGTPLLLHQPSYSMLNRGSERDLWPAARRHGFGIIAFSPLRQGQLTAKYIDAIPPDSRAASSSQFLNAAQITEDLRARLRALQEVAQQRGQSLAQLAIQWVLRDPVMTSALIGARTVAQLEENVAAVHGAAFDAAELARIEEILGG
ncbi:MAG: aldo/keto reductase [Fimbriimonadaceae bacterium]|nr:aldo/keto reductase [Fimbriimonadaceae bacterium]